MHVLETSVLLPGPREEVFEFFADAFNLERLTPPQLRFEILTPAPIEMKAGVRIRYRLRLFGIPFSWRTVISRWEPPDGFVDEQEQGPYRRWIHTHTFHEESGSTLMHDRVEYALPLAPIGDVALPLVRRQLEKIFAFREQAIREIFASEEAR